MKHKVALLVALALLVFDFGYSSALCADCVRSEAKVMNEIFNPGEDKNKQITINNSLKENKDVK